jgi:hypothetical protein
MPAVTTGVGKVPTGSSGAVPSPDPLEGAAPTRRSEEDFGDTVENKITPVPNATIISSTPQRMADEMKPEPDSSGKTTARGKKPDPKKSK